ncbi:TonB-dependent receptor plug domain-containing protein [Zavarzinia sp.]|uniref:TonB-dependent receptor plug domain-containing protein n=1 Tax=Zavarzinia sp. TaxID=2027920 RepID=UPI003565B5A3
MSRSTLPSIVAVSLTALAAALPARGEETVELPLVSVTANRGDETPLTAVGSAVTVITAEELEQKQIRILADALRLIPGVSVNRSGPVGNLTGVSLRGAEANQTLVMIDGVPVNNPAGNSAFDFGHLLTQDIERIEVLRGPQSALYGSDAVGGVVNIVTRKGAGKPRLTISAEGGSDNTGAGNVSVSGGGEQYNFLVGASGYVTSGTSVAAKWRGNSEDDSYRNGTTYAKLGLDPLPNLGFDVVVRETEFRREGDMATVVDPATNLQTLVDDQTGDRGKEFFTRGQARFSLFDGHFTNRLGVSYFNNDNDSFDNAQDGLVTYTARGTAVKYDYQGDYSFETPEFADATHQITLAAEHRDDEMRIFSPGIFGTDLDKDIGQSSLVGQYQLGLFEDLSLTGALRHDWNDTFADSTTYRLTAAYYVTSTDTKFHTSYGTGVKDPTITQLYGFYGTFRGNPDLEPQKGRGWDAGVEQGFLNGKAHLGLTYFRQVTENLISSGAASGGGIMPINLAGTSRAEGIELEASIEPVRNLTVTGTFTHMTTRDPNDQQLTRRPGNGGSLDVAYRFLGGKASVDLGVVYNGAFKDRAFDGFWSPVAVAMDSYTLVNLAASYDLTESVQLYGRVENLFDEEYEEVYSYGENGRTAIAGVKASF